MISHKHKCIFVHLRRTGGNSIEQVLGGISLLDRDLKPTTVWENELHRGKATHKIINRGTGIHSTALDIRAKYPNEYPEYYKFTVIRNPWTQMLSVYFRVKADNSPKGFMRFLKKWNRHEGTVPYQSIYDENGRLIVDKVVRFEDLNAGMSEVFETLGLKEAELPVHNKSAGKNLSEYYPKAARDIVANLYKEDIAEFGYTFPDH